LIYRNRLYLVFILFIISLIVILLRATVHARFIQLLNCMITCIPLLFLHFYCVYNSYTLIRSFAALHHLNFAGISLEFYLYWHMVAWIINISVDIYHMDSWKYHSLHIIRMVKTGFTGLNDTYHCMLWLHLHVLRCDEHVIVEIPWVVHTVYKLYTHVFPLTK